MDILPSAYLLATIFASAWSECLNGGLSFGDGCLCPPDYTGSNCDTHLFPFNSRDFAVKGESTFHKISKRSTEDCLVELFGSAYSGSGSDPDPTFECSGDKRLANGKCQFFRSFEGQMKVNISNQTEELQKQSECLVDEIFDDIKDYAGSNVISVEAGIVTFVVFFGEENRDGSSDLLDHFESTIKNLNLEGKIEAIMLSDIDECAQETDNCDEELAVCENTEGSFTCTCELGYADMADEDKRPGSKCRSVCKDDEGSDYCMNGGECFLTVNGTGVCTCTRNYQGLRCERQWHVYLEAMIGLGATLGAILVIFAVVIMMLCARNKMARPDKSNFVELESNSVNGDFNKVNETNEIKGISNPYVSSDEGITVATNKLDEEGPDVEDDKL